MQALPEIPLGSMNYNVLRNILLQGRVVQLGFGAEIGVLEADTSAYLLAEIPNLSLICVDPWLAYDLYEPERTQANMERAKNTALTKLSQFGQRAMVLEMNSTEAAPRVPDGSLDFIFIDALHTYDAVMSDLQAWYSKVRVGGLVTGHDYRWTGVGEAVVDFATAKGLKGFCTPSASDIWCLIKE